MITSERFLNFLSSKRVVFKAGREKETILVSSTGNVRYSLYDLFQLYSVEDCILTSDCKDAAFEFEVDDMTTGMDGYDPSLFVPGSRMETFTFGDVAVKVVCSEAAVTDYDATGLIVWPASRVLAWYLKQSAAVEGRHVLELGAGCGLTGVAAHSFGAASVLLTDNTSDVLKLLHQTCNMNGFKSETVDVRSLQWGDGEAVEKLISDCKQSNRWPTVVLGADVFQTSFGSPSLLFATVKQLFEAIQLHTSSECVFYTCFALRQTTNEDLIQQSAQDAGFVGEKICIRDMLPEGMHPDDFTKEKLRMTAYRLKK